MKWFRGKWGLVASMALFLAVALVVAWNAPSRRGEAAGLIDERPGTFFGVLIYLMVIGALARYLWGGCGQDPQVRWRKLMGLLLVVTLSSTSLDLYQYFYRSMSYTDWWINPVMLFPGFVLRRWTFLDLLPLFGVDVYSWNWSISGIIGSVVLVGLMAWGMIWFAGEWLLGRVKIRRAMNSALEAGQNPGTSGPG